jgi:hypothetical protein
VAELLRCIAVVELPADRQQAFAVGTADLAPTVAVRPDPVTVGWVAVRTAGTGEHCLPSLAQRTLRFTEGGGKATLDE